MPPPPHHRAWRGANTAIFSTLHAVVLRPLPFRDSDRLVMLFEKNAERGWTQAEVAPANYFDWREQVAAFQDVGAYQSFGTTTVLSHDGEAQVLSSMTVTGNFFTVLGVPAALGRPFTDEETWNTGENADQPSSLAARFGSDSTLVGRTISLWLLLFASWRSIADIHVSRMGSRCWRPPRTRVS
jgi:hypothetical protein